MLGSINTQSQSAAQVPSPPAAWPDWLSAAARTLAQNNDPDERVAFVVDLIQSAADEARLNGLDSVLAHRRHHMECCIGDEPAAPVNPFDMEDLPW